VSVSIFDSFLTTPEAIAAFDDAAVVQAMLAFEAALARAQAAEGLIPPAAASAIGGVCNAQLYDIPALIRAGRRAGSLAIPLVKELQKTVALYDEDAARHVHWGSTSQDVIDTGMVLVTREALRLLDEGLGELTGHLLRLAEENLSTPVLARTLMQPAQVTSLGFKAVGWLAPLVRARAHLREAAARALQLQLGGAVGTLAVLKEHGAAVTARVAFDLRLQVADAAWHTQRDEWVRLGLEVAVLGGSLGKLATDLGLMAQGEVGELAEPSGNGRGGSSAMPHKRNPVSTMIALAAARRTPQHAAALLACMDQQHERGLGNWQAELAEWPQLFLSAHGALHALNEAFAGLLVDRERMLRNIHALHGLVFAEAVSSYLAGAIGRPKAHALLEDLSKQAATGQQGLDQLVSDAVVADPQLAAHVDLDRLAALFDPVAATESPRRLAEAQLHGLRLSMGKLDATHPFHEQVTY
jgi:3-carboxy-cis,cis-muconate cycloisomerase